ncbi:MAG: hypothetical protein ACRCXT_07165 [Paraclostridium sp.]
MRSEIMNGKLVVLCQEIKGDRPEFYKNSDIIRVHEGETEDTPVIFTVYPAGVSYEYNMPLFENGVQVGEELVVLDCNADETIIEQAKECGLEITNGEMLDALITNDVLITDEVSIFMISNDNDEEATLESTELKNMSLKEVYNKIAYIENAII